MGQIPPCEAHGERFVCAGEPAFPANERRRDEDRATCACEIVHHRHVGGVFGEIGLHVEENVEKEAQGGSGVAREIVLGHLRERGKGHAYAVVEEKAVIFLFSQVEKTVMIGMASFEIVGYRLPIVDVAFEFARLWNPRKAHNYKEERASREN